MKKQIALFLAINCICFFSACKSSQGVDSNVETSEPLPNALALEKQIDFFEVDKFENIYVVNEKELQVLTSDFEFRYRYENDRLGHISSIDVTNPLKILVFYDDFDIIVLLDRSLAEISQIDLNQLGFSDISQVAMSNDNKIWFYDSVTFRLLKIDNTGKIVRESLPLYSQYLEPNNLSQIIEKNNMVYMADKDLGIMVFDNFAQFIKTIPLKGLDDFQIINNNIVYLDTDRGMLSYGTEFFAEFQIEGLDERNRSQMKQIRLSNIHCFYGFPQGIRKTKR